MAICSTRGETLPIMTSEEIRFSVETYTTNRFIIGDYWIGLTCDTDTNALMWQDGQALEYNAFYDPIDPGCTDDVAFANWLENACWGPNTPDTVLPFILCARRLIIEAEAKTSTTENSYPTEQSTNYDDFTSTISIDSSTLSNTNFYESSPETSATESATTITESNNSSIFPLWIIIVVVIFFCGCFIAFILLVRRRIMSLRARVVEEQLDGGKNLDADTVRKANYRRYYGPPGKNNEWEIERRFVGIDYLSKLGVGAFGSVFLGRVRAKNIPSVVGRSLVEFSSMINENNSVAVKMLRENADAEKKLKFKAEIEIMQRIGSHERLVNILACVTTSDPNMLICEYCANGDLLNFLRRKRTFMLANPDEIATEKIITTKKQMMFAIQIAYGLEYISSRGFVHRDIAARNIMLDGQERCKIGDFGLARFVGEEDGIYHAQAGKLPLKWMSPEAIEHYFFSSVSDVWSFGVLLFEIVTLGGTPYAGWPVSELLTRLKQNERMERPDNCSENLYGLMRACWSEKSTDRPTFTELRKNLGELLEDISEDGYYLKLNANANYYVLGSNASD